MLNLCIRNKDTASLGIGRHVCELQLSLRAFASLAVRTARSPALLAARAPLRARRTRLCA